MNPFQKNKNKIALSIFFSLCKLLCLVLIPSTKLVDDIKLPSLFKINQEHGLAKQPLGKFTLMKRQALFGINDVKINV